MQAGITGLLGNHNTKTQLMVEMSSICAWWGSYHLSKQLKPFEADVANVAVSGAISGIPIALLSHQFQIRHFPELKADFRVQFHQKLPFKTCRIAAGHVVFCNTFMLINWKG